MSIKSRGVKLPKRFIRSAKAAVPLDGDQTILVEIVSDRLSNGFYKMLSDPCPCGEPGVDMLLSEVDRYGLPVDTVLCSACGTLRANPYPDDGGLADFYTHYYQQMYARSGDREAYFKKQRAYGQRVLDSVRHWLPQGSFVFEAGCGAGGALEVLRQGGYETSGCDYSQELVDYGCSRGLSLYWGPPLDVLKPPVPAPALIYMHHVFEHVRDPLSQLLGLRELLAPRGKILIIVPDVSRIGEFPFPAGDLRLFLHIAHRYNFSLEGFRCLAARAGLKVDSLEQRDAHGSPELWALLSNSTEAEGHLLDPNAGCNMLAYLRRTERLRNLGFTQGQLKNIPAYIRWKIMRLGHRISRLFVSS